MVQPFGGEGRIDPTLEAVARVRIDPERAPRVGDLHRIPVGAFDEDAGGGVGAAGALAAHDAGDADRAGVVRDDDLAFGEGVGPLVQRLDGLAALRAVHAQVALQLVRIEDVQRAVEVVGIEIRHIDQEADRPQPDAAQTRLQPVGAGAVGDPLDQPAAEQRAAVGRVFRDSDTHRRGALPRDLRRRERLERAQPPRRQVTRHAAHAQRIGAVRRNGDLDHRIDPCGIVLGQPVGEALPDLAGGQLDDPVVLVRQFQLALRGHHPVAFDAADRAHADRGVDARHVDAGMGDHDSDALARVRRAADDLLQAVTGLHLADLQLVRVGMLLRTFDPADGEGPQPLGRVFDPLDLEPEVGERLRQDLDRGVGLEMGFQPG